MAPAAPVAATVQPACEGARTESVCRLHLTDGRSRDGLPTTVSAWLVKTIKGPLDVHCERQVEVMRQREFQD